MSELRSWAKVLGATAVFCLMWWAGNAWRGLPVNWDWTVPIAFGLSLAGFLFDEHARRIASLKARIANLERMTGNSPPFPDDES